MASATRSCCLQTATCLARHAPQVATSSKKLQAALQTTSSGKHPIPINSGFWAAPHVDELAQGAPLLTMRKHAQF